MEVIRSSQKMGTFITAAARTSNPTIPPKLGQIIDQKVEGGKSKALIVTGL
jgi:hypothetical protein